MLKTLCYPFLLMALLLTMPATVFAQPNLQNSRQVSQSKIATAEEIVKEILDVLGLEQNFILLEGNVPNAAAATISGKQYIIYNQRFLDVVSKAAKTNRTGTFIFAHEIAHLHKGHLYSRKRHPHKMELEADEFAGSVMRTLNIPLSETLAAVRVMSDSKDNETHPGRNKRLAAVERGWRSGAEKPALAQRYIFREVYLFSQPDNPVYLTTKMHLVTVSNNRIKILGKAKSTSNKMYLIIGRQKMVITKSGQILNSSNQRVGYISKPKP